MLPLKRNHLEVIGTYEAMNAACKAIAEAKALIEQGEIQIGKLLNEAMDGLRLTNTGDLLTVPSPCRSEANTFFSPEYGNFFLTGIECVGPSYWLIHFQLESGSASFFKQKEKDGLPRGEILSHFKTDGHQAVKLIQFIESLNGR